MNQLAGLAACIACILLAISQINISNSTEPAKRAGAAIGACIDNPSYEDPNELFGQCVADYYFMKGWTK